MCIRVSPDVFNILLQGSLPLTDKSKWLEDNFTDDENIVFYDLNELDSIPEIIKNYLDNPEKSKEIIKNGFNEVADKYKSITVSTVAAKLGYGKELYFPTDEKKQYFTTGEYIRKVEKMAEKGLISEGKKEELLMDAYRADIVYNFDEEETNLND